MFVYTKNEEVIKQLEKDCKFIQKRSDGISVYVLLPSSTYKFANEENTWLSNLLTF